MSHPGPHPGQTLSNEMSLCQLLQNLNTSTHASDFRRTRERDMQRIWRGFAPEPFGPNGRKAQRRVSELITPLGGEDSLCWYCYKRGVVHLILLVNIIMKNSPKHLNVSVIVPVYNGGEKFRRCLESLKRTLPPPLEI